MKRNEFNRNILEKCIKFLKSNDATEVYEGVVLSAYFLEQIFKSELRKINPFLYFDHSGMSPETEINIVLEKISPEEMKRLKTITPTRSIDLICKYKNELEVHKVNFKELFHLRNYLVHSVDDIKFDILQASEISLSALNTCKKYFSKSFGIELNVLSSKRFDQLYEEKREKRILTIHKSLQAHRRFFKELNKQEVKRRIRENLPVTDQETWLQETVKCPACQQKSFDKVGFIDVDWSPDETIINDSFYYKCRVCELELSEYEYTIVISSST